MVRQQAPVAGIEMALLWSIKAGVLLLLLTPLIITPETLFPFIVGKALYSRAIIEVIVGLWLVLLYSYPAYRPPRSWVIAAFAIYLLVALLAAVTGVSLERSLWSNFERMQGIVDLAHWFALTLVLISVFRSFSGFGWRLLLNINLGISLVVAIIGVTQSFHTSILPFYGFLTPAPGAQIRLDSTLGNATYVGAFMVVNILVALAFLAQSLQPRQAPVQSPARQGRRRRKQQAVKADTSTIWWQLFWVVTIGLDLWVLVMTGGRGALIGLAAGLAVFGIGYLAWGQLRPGRIAAATLIGLMVVVAIIFAVIRTTPIVEKSIESGNLVGRISSIGTGDISIKGRMAAMSAGVEGFVDRPILGWGPENYGIAWARHFDSESGVRETFDQAHNKLVEELTTKGILGLLCYLALWALMARIILRSIRRPDPYQQLFVMLVGAALVAYFVQNLFLFDTASGFLQFILLVGYLVFLETTLEKAEEVPGDRRLRGSGEEPGRGPAAQPAWRMQIFAPLNAVRAWLRPLWRLSGVGRINWPKSEAVTLYGALAVLLLVSLLVYYINYRPYHASKIVVQTAAPAISWEQRFGYFEESISSFPQLATYPRLIMFGQITDNWGNMNEEEAKAALALVEKEARRALDADPQGWRIYVALSRLYAQASLLDPANLARAEGYLKRAIELAPETLEVTTLKEQWQVP